MSCIWGLKLYKSTALLSLPAGVSATKRTYFSPFTKDSRALSPLAIIPIIGTLRCTLLEWKLYAKENSGVKRGRPFLSLLAFHPPVPHSNKQDYGTLIYIEYNGMQDHTYLFGHLPLSTRRGWVWWARHCTLLLWPRPTSPTGVARRSYLFKWWDLRKSLPTFLTMNKSLVG